MPNPYAGLPPRAFWRPAVAERDALAIDELWQPRFPIAPTDPIATAGSCFARHIGRALQAQGHRWVDAEPAPRSLTPAQAQAHGYGLFSCRVGNVYTVAQLRQWLEWSHGVRPVDPELWRDEGRVQDPFRPGVEPGGYASDREAAVLRATTLRALRTALSQAQVFIFTLGLVEGWTHRHTGSVYPVCPGVAGGRFDPDLHVWRRWRHAEIAADLQACLRLLHTHHPSLRVVLTVSPVPLTATMSGEHVLVATQAAKATLRSVAAEAVADDPLVDYFPSYEIIASHPYRGRFFEANGRSVSPDGVAHVMRQFFAGLRGTRAVPAALDAPTAASKASDAASEPATEADADEHCDEALLDAFRPQGPGR